MKLNPEELNVTSFDTSPLAAPGSDTAAIIVTTNDPTAATRCFICPQETYNCY
jgi:hypothetical protein